MPLVELKVEYLIKENPSIEKLAEEVANGICFE